MKNVKLTERINKNVLKTNQWKLGIALTKPLENVQILWLVILTVLVMGVFSDMVYSMLNTDYEKSRSEVSQIMDFLMDF